MQGKEVNVQTLIEALLQVIRGTNTNEQGKIEASLCLRYLMETFKSEITHLKDIVMDAQLDAMQHAPAGFKIQLIKNIGNAAQATESIVVNLICALNDSDPRVVKAAVNALGNLGITSREELYNRMQEYHMLNEFKMEAQKTKWVHPLDVILYSCRLFWLNYKMNDKQKSNPSYNMLRIGERILTREHLELYLLDQIVQL